MKEYINKSPELRSVTFVDGTTQFLMRGQKFSSDAETVKVQPGIVVKDVVSEKKTSSKASTAVVDKE